MKKSGFKNVIVTLFSLCLGGLIVFFIFNPTLFLKIAAVSLTIIIFTAAAFGPGVELFLERRKKY